MCGTGAMESTTTYLDGLSGLSAIQVILNHYADNFAPIQGQSSGIVTNRAHAVSRFFCWPVSS